MFGKLAEKLTAGVNKLSGRTDLLEGIAAAAALVAAADGDIADEEVGTIIETLGSHAVLSKSFKTSEIENIADKMIRRAKGGAAGRLGLLREIEEAKAKSKVEDLEMLLVIAIDVSMADGELGAAERKVLTTVASKLGLNLNSYLEV